MSEPGDLRLELPIPPSINCCFVNVLTGRGGSRASRARSKKYRAWASAAGWHLKIARPKKVAGATEIEILVARPNKNSDVDNRIKPVLDLLVTHGVIDDDRHVESTSARWARPGDGVEAGMVAVIIRPAA